MAVGIACAGTGLREATSLLEPMLLDATDFVQQVGIGWSGAGQEIWGGGRLLEPTGLKCQDIRATGEDAELQVPGLSSSFVVLCQFCALACCSVAAWKRFSFLSLLTTPQCLVP